MYSQMTPPTQLIAPMMPMRRTTNLAALAGVLNIWTMFSKVRPPLIPTPRQALMIRFASELTEATWETFEVRESAELISAMIFPEESRATIFPDSKYRSASTSALRAFSPCFIRESLSAFKDSTVIFSVIPAPSSSPRSLLIDGGVVTFGQSWK